MDRAEQFIQEYSRVCSNEFYYGGVRYQPWLTPDQARKAVEIAKEELIDKACEWLENLYAPDGSIIPEHIKLISDFRKAMEGEK